VEPHSRSVILAHAASRIDIVVPVYNAPEDLRCCAESVLACTSGDFRLLLIDRSTDPGNSPGDFDIVKHRVGEIENESEALRDYIRTA